jgi:hypothetical protein
MTHFQAGLASAMLLCSQCIHLALNKWSPGHCTHFYMQYSQFCMRFSVLSVVVVSTVVLVNEFNKCVCCYLVELPSLQACPLGQRLLEKF